MYNVDVQQMISYSKHGVISPLLKIPVADKFLSLTTQETSEYYSSSTAKPSTVQEISEQHIPMI